MATTLDRTLTIQLSGNFDNPLDNTTPTQPIDYTRMMRVTNGTSTGQGSNFFEDTRSLASSTSEVLNLNSLASNAYGATISFSRIKTLWMIASSTNSAAITVGGSTTTTFPIFGSSANSITLRPGAQFVMNDDGATAYGSTNGNLQVLSSAGPSAYRIFVDGATA